MESLDRWFGAVITNIPIFMMFIVGGFGLIGIYLEDDTPYRNPEKHHKVEGTREWRWVALGPGERSAPRKISSLKDRSGYVPKWISHCLTWGVAGNSRDSSVRVVSKKQSDGSILFQFVASRYATIFWRSNRADRKVCGFRNLSLQNPTVPVDVARYRRLEFVALESSVLRRAKGAAYWRGYNPESERQKDAGITTPAKLEADLGLNANSRRLIQQKLKTAGFDPQGIDGAFGTNTRRALRQWQRANGYSETGYLTRSQFARLQTSGTSTRSPSPISIGQSRPQDEADERIDK